jgi:DNA polymerase I-like protein with 3'-5' exonuclease and polymerase domains
VYEYGTGRRSSDELVYEVTEKQARACAELVRTGMESCVELRVPLRVAVKMGVNLEEMENYDK